MTVYEFYENSEKAYAEFIEEHEEDLTNIECLLIRKMFNIYILDMVSRGLSCGLLQDKIRIESEDK